MGIIGFKKDAPFASKKKVAISFFVGRLTLEFVWGEEGSFMMDASRLSLE